MAPLLEMRDIRKSFLGVEVLHGVGLDCEAGEIHAVVGENGAGKSTLMKVLAGVHSPDAGEVRIDGEPVQLLPPGPGPGRRRRDHLPGVQPAPRPHGRGERVRQPRADAPRARRHPRDGAPDRGAARGGRRGLVRPPHARAQPVDRPAAGRRDRQGALARRAHPRPRRADRRARRARGRGAVHAAAPPARARAGDALHLPPPARDLHDLRPHHGPEGRRARGDAAGRRGRHRTS